MVKSYIQSIRSRKKMAYDLGDLTTSIVHGPVDVVFDENMEGPLFNFLQICRRIADSGQPAFILQDDSVWHPQAHRFIPDVRERLEEEEAVSLFAPPRKAFNEAKLAGCNWVRNWNHLWQPAIGLSARVAEGVVKFAESDANQETHHDDVVLQQYLKSVKMPIWVTLPSLVQHNVNVPSAAGNPKKVGKLGYRVTRIWQKEIPSDHFDEIRAHDAR